MYYKCFFIIILFCLLTSNKCKPTQVVIDTDFKSYIKDTLNLKTYPNYNLVISYLIKQKQFYFIYNETFHKILFANDKGNITKELACDSMVSKTEYVTFNQDSIYILNEDDEIYSFDTNGKFGSKVTLPYKALYYYSSLPTFLFEVRYPYVFILQFLRETITNTKIFFKHIQSTNDVIFNLQTQQIEPSNNIGFQKSILTKNYNVFTAYRTINDKQELVYSYDHSSTIYTYNYITQQKKEFKSNYRKELIREDTIVYEKKKDDDYERKYHLENKIYFNIIFNPYKKCYYRILLDSIPFTDADGEVNELYDKPMELEIMDSEFNIQKIVKIPARQFLVFSAIACKEGILILTDKQNKPKHTTYVKLSL